MAESAHAAMLADGRRLHLQEGPIDLVIEAFGSEAAVRGAYRRAEARFDGLLAELCGELGLLRQRVSERSSVPIGRVARRMHNAVSPFAAETFVTPMAAVAGSVAEAVLSAAVDGTGLVRTYVNNGGDIALHLAPGESFRIGIVGRPDRPSMIGTAEVRAEGPVRGIATSGWRGRSFSFGIADAVTVLAASAAAADVAATLVANAVDLPGHPAIERRPARDLQPDSDLGERAVTRTVGRLSAAEVDEALASGCERAETIRRRGLLHAAVLHLAGQTRVIGPLSWGSSEQARNLLHA